MDIVFEQRYISPGTILVKNCRFPNCTMRPDNIRFPRVHGKISLSKSLQIVLKIIILIFITSFSTGRKNKHFKNMEKGVTFGNDYDSSTFEIQVKKLSKTAKAFHSGRMD